ncbi:MAG: 2-C-methyl-D-erythritol 4-phosphate cytidylyltransferase [Chitinophagaceae bacterium]|nr:2-C-methyl-D-erythritol 4-phosphate cytidylyltransferase [Chitinophagaceae bacterium]
MKKFAVITAAGTGTRMGTATPKQFLILHGKPVLWYTIQAFLSTFDDIIIILVLPKEYIEAGEKLVSQFDQQILITEGGSTRFQSVKNGLALIQEQGIVFVHDGVRCMVSAELITRCFYQALEKGSAIPAVAATDSIRIQEGSVHNVIDRNAVRIVQTPQTFKTEILLPAFEQTYVPAFTDEATVVEASGAKVYLIEGDYRNLKITRPVDLLIAESLLQESKLG